MLRITVSFKQTSRDLKLYTTVNSLEEKSDFIKDALEHYLKYLEVTKSKENGRTDINFWFRGNYYMEHSERSSKFMTETL